MNSNQGDYNKEINEIIKNENDFIVKLIEIKKGIKGINKGA